MTISRARHIRDRIIGEFFADDNDSNSPQYHSLTDPFPDARVVLCPTCGRDIIPGFVNPGLVQCPGCQTDIDLAKGKYQYRTRVPNRTRGNYGS